MKMRILLTLALGLGLLLAGCTTRVAEPPSPGAAEVANTQAVRITAAHVPNQVVVGYFEESDLAAITAALPGSTVRATIPELRAALIELPSGLDASQALGRLAGQEGLRLRYAQPSFTIPRPEPVGQIRAQALNDPLLPAKWDHQVMQAQAAWDTAVNPAAPLPADRTPSGRGVVIGIVDTGIDATHPDLAGQMVNGFSAWPWWWWWGCPPGVIPPNIDASAGSTHGTHVAGIAAARGNNAQGVAGVAFGARLMDIRVFCGDWTTDFIIADGITAAITDRDGDGIVPDVLNLSLGGKGYSQVIKDALDMATSGFSFFPLRTLPCYDGPTCATADDDGTPDRTVTVVIAMGNSNQDEVFYPAGFPGMIAVGATNAQDRKAGFSTLGGHISVGAPGEDILSTWPTWALNAERQPLLYYRISGTSMSAPQVAGAAALVKQFFPGYSSYQVRRILEASADDIGPGGFDRGAGHGRINLKNLADRLAATRAETDMTDFRGGAARVDVSTLNLWDSNHDGLVGEGDVPWALEAVDVQLLQGGVVKYQAKTSLVCLATPCTGANLRASAFFNQITPGVYDVLVAGQDITDWADSARWPQERVGNPLAIGALTVLPGMTVNHTAPVVGHRPATHSATLNSTMTVTLTWTGGGDLDLAVREFNPDADPGLPVAPAFQWRGVKADPGGPGAAPIVAGGLWGTFSADSTDGVAAETYTLNPAHYPSPAAGSYLISINARNATVGTTAFLEITLNGITKRSGPIPITPGSAVSSGTGCDSNCWRIFSYIWAARLAFDNIVTIY
jgi:subtilisin family serine protease